MNLKNILKDATGEISNISSEVKELSQVHAQLLKVEAKECTDFIKLKVIAGVTLALIAFFLVCVLLTAGISALGIFLKDFMPKGLQPYSWHLIASGVSLLFLILIMICFSLLKKKPQESFFSHTKKELQNDKIWLQNLSKQKRKSS